MVDFLLLAVFGLVGIFSRFAVDRFFSHGPAEFPVATLIVNMLGCLAVGLIFALTMQREILPRALALPLIVGFAGGFTTFSAYALQTLNMLQHGLAAQAITYWVLSPVLGVVFVWIGIRLAG